MTCEEIEIQIAAYLDGEVTESDKAAITQHLTDCTACWQEAQSLNAAAQSVRGLPGLAPSAGWDLQLERKLSAVKVLALTEEVGRLCAITDKLASRLRGLEAAGGLAPPDLMTVDELAAYLRVSPDRVYEMMHELPRIEMNYDVRFRRSSIDQWLKLREENPGAGWIHWDQWISGSQPSLS